jgi:hypothetical protein
MNTLFLYKDIELEKEGDRDCVVYINATPAKFECNHYFGGTSLQNACFSGRDLKKIEYKSIKTFLTEEEFTKLQIFYNSISNLGYGIVKGDERYNKGIELINNIQPIFDKLNSKDGKEFQNQIIEEEINYLMDEFDIDEDDIKEIFELTDYKDRSFILAIYRDISEVAEDEAYELGYATKENERWFDFESFGNDLLDDSRYHELSDGRIVLLSE